MNLFWNVFARPVSNLASLGPSPLRFVKPSAREVVHARSRAPDQALRVAAGGAGPVILATARASAGMPRPERFRQEHDREDAHGTVATDARHCSVRRSQHSRRSGGLPEAPWLCPGRGSSLLVPERLGISGADRNSARDAAQRSREEDRFPAGTVFPASEPARQHWIVLEGNAAADFAHCRDHG